jgi:hypothetical protein
MSTKRLLIVGLPLAALAIVLVLLAWRRESATRSVSTGGEPAQGSIDSTGDGSVRSSGRGSEQATLPSRPASVRKTTPELRTKLLEAIRAAHGSPSAAPASSPRTAPGPASSPGSDVPAGNDDSAEDPDRDYVTGAMEGIVPMLMDCYARALERLPHLSGRVVITFTIEGAKGVGGVISESTIDPTESDLSDPEVQECMRNTIYAVEVDPPTSGETVRVTYPFTFSPPGK